MARKVSSTIAGRVDLSQRVFTLPSGEAARLWSLAPASIAKTAKSLRRAGYRPGMIAADAVESVPNEHRETVWLQTEDGDMLGAVVDTRDDRAVVTFLNGFLQGTAAA